VPQEQSEEAEEELLALPNEPQGAEESFRECVIQDELKRVKQVLRTTAP
jgi:hypothetical protein